MKATITKRSKKDGTLVTIPLKQFDETDLDFLRGACSVGEEAVAVIEGVPVVCTLARPNEYGVPTVMTTHGLPRFIRLPQVGRPVTVEITEIR